MEIAATPADTRFVANTDTSLFRVFIALFGLACLPIGLLWDVSHHTTIGRDTFWTPAHIIIQLGGIVPATLFAILALKTTFSKSPAARDASVSFWGAHAPVGVWLTIWGCVAMVSSAPFDDWWHATYGLDVKIISPPHSILGLGMFAVGMGILLFVFSSQNQVAPSLQKHRGIFCAVAVGIMITLWADFTTEYSWPNLQHGAFYYRVLCTPYPLMLVLAARAARIRGAATIAALTYMLIYISLILILPLFPAHPKLAPIYHPVDHMVPPMFPILLVLPAIAIDLLEWKFGGKKAARWWQDWLLAGILGAAFLIIALPVQWNFSEFLLSDAADNRFFARSGHWPYFSKPGSWMNTFWTERTAPLNVSAIFRTLITACISTRIGLWFGNYLLRLRR